MADLSDKMKKAWLKSMEAIGNTASNIANNTRYKVNEMTLLNRRREILSDFGARAYDLWQKGEVFPEELAKQLEELSQVDTQLNALRMERLAGVENPEGSGAAPEAETASEADEAAGQPAAEQPATEQPAGEEAPAAQATPEITDNKSQLADMANQALDTIGNTLKSVGSFLGDAISNVTDTLAGRKNTPVNGAGAASAPEQPAPPAEETDTPAQTEAEQAAASKPVPQPDKEAAPESAPAESEPESPEPAAAPLPEEEDENPDEYKVE